MKVSVHWLKDFVELKPPLEALAEQLTMAGLEVKKIERSHESNDTLFDVEVTTNRPDWLSHIGVAREIAAVTARPLKIPPVLASNKRPWPTGWKISTLDKEACPYYTGVLIEGIEWCETPDVIKKRLLAAGLRSINLIVDITNYVLLETGQPLHAFDADLLQGQEIQIRPARAGERMTAIDGSNLELQAKDLVITDARRPVALAGVMGGKETEVSERTRNILLESAFFHPRWVRQTSRRFGLASESSYRFERRVDPEGVDFGRERALYLLAKYAKPRAISGILKVGQKPALVKKSVSLTGAEVSKKLGIAIKPSQVTSIFKRLGLRVRPSSKAGWQVDIPSFRSDLIRSVDLIEEIARIYGYGNIPETLPSRPPLFVQANPRHEVEQKARHFFVGAGYYETVTFSLISGLSLEPEKDLKNALSIHNPQNQELKWLRPVLLPSLLEVTARNHRLGAKSVPLFEIANVYRTASQGRHPEEERTLGISRFGHLRESSWLDPDRNVSYYDLKGAVIGFLDSLGLKGYLFQKAAHPCLKSSSSEKIMMESTLLGYLGEVAPRLMKAYDLDSSVHFAELSLDKIALYTMKVRKAEDLSKYPAVERDLAIVVPEATKAGDIEREIQELGEGLIRRVEIFDLFRGGRIPKGHKNLAFHLTYQSHERTLLSEEIQKLHMRIAEAIAKKYQASFQETSR